MIEKWVNFSLAELNTQLIELFEIPASVSYSIYGCILRWDFYARLL